MTRNVPYGQRQQHATGCPYRDGDEWCNCPLNPPGPAREIITEEQAKINAMVRFLKDIKALAITRGDKYLENLASQGLCHCGCHTRDWWIEPCLHCTPKGCAGERYV